MKKKYHIVPTKMATDTSAGVSTASCNFLTLQKSLSVELNSYLIQERMTRLKLEEALEVP